MSKINDLMVERRKLVEKAREVVNHAESENRDLSGEEASEYDEIETGIQERTNRIERLQRAERLDLEAAEEPKPQPEPDDGPKTLSFSDQFRQLATGERRSLEVSFGDAERRTLIAGQSAAGGNTVPETFVAQLFEHMTETATLRQTNVQNLTTQSGERMYWPRVTQYGTAFRVGEAETLDEGDPEFGQVELDAHKYGRILYISSELLQDTGVDLQGFIARDSGRAIGEATGADYMTGGSQSNRPDGLVPNVDVGVDGPLDFDHLIQLYYSVIGPYRQNATWLMHDSTAAQLRLTKDGNDQYVWQQSVREGEPDRILGLPVRTEINMPTGADSRAVLFGDLSAYMIRDVGSVRFERSDDFRFNDDVVAFRVIFRTDGKLVDTSGAVKALEVGDNSNGDGG